MYRGFDLRFNLNKHKDSTERLYKKGLEQYNNNKRLVGKSLRKHLLSNGNIDGSALQNKWFPQIEAEIFLSHSHEDEETAIALAGWLYINFDIKTFIDSCVWGNYYDLLKSLDNHFSLRRDGNYDYDTRNFTTGHVHLMLSMALNTMIDNTECLFFLNTPRSISSSETVNKTKSPWLYSEITMSKLIEKKAPEKHRVGKRGVFSKSKKQEMLEGFEYQADLSHLKTITRNDLLYWYDSLNSSENPLDTLYKTHPPLKM